MRTYRIEYTEEPVPLYYTCGDSIMIDVQSRPQHIYLVHADSSRDAILVFLDLNPKLVISSIKATLVEIIKQ